MKPEYIADFKITLQNMILWIFIKIKLKIYII